MIQQDGQTVGGSMLTFPPPAPGAGSGDVVGPGSATNNALAVFDGPTGKLLRNGTVTHPSANLLDELGTIQSNDGNTFLKDSQGNQVVKIVGSSVLTIVNSIEIHGGITTAGCQINPIGESNIDLIIRAAGTGDIQLTPITGNVDVTAGDLVLSSGELQFFTDSKGILDANGNKILNFSAAGSAVNYVEIANATTGTAGPTIRPAGEANVDLRLAPAGTGQVYVVSGDVNIAAGDLIVDGTAGEVRVDGTSGASFSMGISGSSTAVLSTVSAGGLQLGGSINEFNLNDATLYGGTGSGDDLNLRPTKHATSGEINFLIGGVAAWAIKGSTSHLSSAAGVYLGIGIGATTTPDEMIHGYHATAGIYKLETEAGPSKYQMFSYAGSAAGKASQIQCYRTRGTLSSPSVNVTNDQIGALSIHPWFGGSFYARAGVIGKCDGTQSSASALPTRLTFGAGTSANTERGRVNSDGTFEMDSWVGFNGVSAAAPTTFSISGTYTPDTTLTVNTATITLPVLADIVYTLIAKLKLTGIVL